MAYSLQALRRTALLKGIQRSLLILSLGVWSNAILGLLWMYMQADQLNTLGLTLLSICAFLIPPALYFPLALYKGMSRIYYGLYEAFLFPLIDPLAQKIAQWVQQVETHTVVEKSRNWLNTQTQSMHRFIRWTFRFFWNRLPLAAWVDSFQNMQADNDTKMHWLHAHIHNSLRSFPEHAMPPILHFTLPINFILWLILYFLL